MKIAVVFQDGVEKTVIRNGDHVYLLEAVIPAYHQSFATLLDEGHLEALQQALAEVDLSNVEPLQKEDLHYFMVKTNGQHVFGMGANYVEKAEDLNIVAEKPVCFMKLREQLVGPSESIEIPAFSKLVTAEGELALIIGKRCENVSSEEALDYVAGYTTAFDLTAKDLHAENPRFLQMVKLFNGSCSYGPEIQLGTEGLQDLEVKTLKNGEVIHRNVVANMMYSPATIVSYLSQFVTLVPGDLILTGTPGSFEVQPGDEAQCYVTGLEMLRNGIVS